MSDQQNQRLDHVAYCEDAVRAINAHPQFTALGGQPRGDQPGTRRIVIGFYPQVVPAAGGSLLWTDNSGWRLFLGDEDFTGVPMPGDDRTPPADDVAAWATGAVVDPQFLFAVPEPTHPRRRVNEFLRRHAATPHPILEALTEPYAPT